MSMTLSNIKGSIEHIKGELLILDNEPSPELKIALKQAEKAITDFETYEFANLIKAAAL